jgi:hypothetical protein
VWPELGDRDLAQSDARAQFKHRRHSGSRKRIGALVARITARPRTQIRSIRCGAAAASSRCHKSTFKTGFSPRRQPRFFHFGAQMVMAFLHVLAVGYKAAPWQRRFTPLAARGDLAIRRPPHAAVAVEDAVRKVPSVGLPRPSPTISRASVIGFAGHPTMRGSKLPSSLLVSCIP